MSATEGIGVAPEALDALGRAAGAVAVELASVRGEFDRAVLDGIDAGPATTSTAQVAVAAWDWLAGRIDAQAAVVRALAEAATASAGTYRAGDGDAAAGLLDQAPGPR